jgi:tryptophan synthase alpha chain
VSVMNRLEKLSFFLRQSESNKLFAGYVMAGFPDEETSLNLARGLIDNGADLLEIGVPFSDPLADGEVIQRCGEMALAGGASLESALNLCRKIRTESDCPLLIMSYLNPLLGMGFESFACTAAACGVDGVIIPDLPPEEALEFIGIFKKFNIKNIFLATPTSDLKRLKKITALADGFIYVVSVAGVTGERNKFDDRLKNTIINLRKLTKLPLLIGFGISDQSSAALATQMADGVIAASTVLKNFLENKDQQKALENALAKARLLIETVKKA